jgi:hypothetical protein
MPWVLNPVVRLRPIPEMQCCLAYLPNAKGHRPELYGLNLTSWLALSLCDGRDDRAIEQEFAEAIRGGGSQGMGAGTLGDALSELARLGLIQRTEEPHE